MSSFFKKLIACALLCAIAVATVSCKKKKGEDDANTLYVYSFTSGFGSEWLTEAIKDYKDATGITVKPTTVKNDVHGADMKNRQEVVYFLEQQDYHGLVSNNYVADITAAITGVNPYDSKTLESKMFDDQKSYFKRNGSYYAYPHYFTSFGIVYDVEMFDTKGFYFKDGYSATASLAAKFISSGDTKTAGPDGVKGNADDGLPTTYEEFLWLCEYISSKSLKPVLWAGETATRKSYLTHLINAIATDYEGREQMRLNFTFSGTAKNLGTVQAGQFVFDSKDTPITTANGYELARQAGKYYAMDFYSDLYEIVKRDADSANTLFNSSYSHNKAQEDFLANETYAMLFDGSWWQTEATSVFNEMGAVDSAYSKQERKLGWLPLPKHSSKVGEKQTMYDVMYPLCFVKNIDVNSWEYKTAIDFIQFINSDAQIAKFNKITNCPKSLKYDLTSAQIGELSYFGKSLYSAYKSADVVFPFANNTVFNNNQLKLQEIDKTGTGSPLYKSAAGNVFVESLENGVKLDVYFNGMYTYFQNLGIWA